MEAPIPLRVRQALKMLGFSDNEIKIVTFFFSQKKASSREVSQKTAISFSATHYSLSNLEKRGILRSTSDNGDDIFEICSEKEFFEWIESQKRKNSEIYDKAQSSLSGFFTNLQESHWKPNVTYYEGIEGIKEIYEDLIETGEDIFSWLDIPKIYDALGDFLYDYIRRRMKKGITSHDILPRNEMNEKHFQKNENREVKFVDHLPIDGEIRIYGNKVALISFHKEKPVGFVFQGAVFTQLFRAIFENAWKSQ